MTLCHSEGQLSILPTNASKAWKYFLMKFPAIIIISVVPICEGIWCGLLISRYFYSLFNSILSSFMHRYLCQNEFRGVCDILLPNLNVP